MIARSMILAAPFLAATMGHAATGMDKYGLPDMPAATAAETLKKPGGGGLLDAAMAWLADVAPMQAIVPAGPSKDESATIGGLEDVATKTF